MSKGPDAFRTISEVAEELDLPQHVLRFWETRFAQIKPMKRGGGRRYYRPDDVDLLRGIRRLLYGEGYTIKGVQRILKEQGPRHVVAAGQGGSFDPAPQGVDPGDDYADDLPEGILPDDDQDDFVAVPRERRPVAPQTRDAPQDREAGFSRGERREPVFGSSSGQGSAPQVRAPQDRAAESPARGRAEPPPSWIPAAPPDDPDSLEEFLPPLVAESPAPPMRVRGAPRADDSEHVPSFDARREPSMSRPAVDPSKGEPSFGSYTPVPREAEPYVPQRPAPPRRDVPVDSPIAGPARSGSGHIARDDLRLLHAALSELLECKRILDQAR